MKTKLQILIVAFAIALPSAMALAQAVNPATGLPASADPAPIDPTTGLPIKTVVLDPATGLPADGSPPFNGASGAPNWIDSSWADPGKVLSSVDYEQLPVSEVARHLRQQFTNYFDIILPASGPADPTTFNVTLQLKNVTASEIFNAMNLEFQLEKTPLRWELTSNGSRPTALLRYLPQLAPPAPPQARKVFYVGNLLDGFSGTNDDQKLAGIADTVHHACDVTGANNIKIDLYPSGQLLIVSGTPDQVDLVEQTLRALTEKVLFEASNPKKQPVNTR